MYYFVAQPTLYFGFAIRRPFCVTHALKVIRFSGSKLIRNDIIKTVDKYCEIQAK